MKKCEHSAFGPAVVRSVSCENSLRHIQGQCGAVDQKTEMHHKNKPNSNRCTISHRSWLYQVTLVINQKYGTEHSSAMGVCLWKPTCKDEQHMYYIFSGPPEMKQVYYGYIALSPDETVTAISCCWKYNALISTTCCHVPRRFTDTVQDVPNPTQTLRTQWADIAHLYSIFISEPKLHLVDMEIIKQISGSSSSPFHSGETVLNLRPWFRNEMKTQLTWGNGDMLHHECTVAQPWV